MQILHASLIVDSRCLLGESIVWCTQRRVLYWADIQGATLWRHCPERGDTRSWPVPQALGCVALGEEGRLVLGLAKGLYVCDVEAQLDAPALDLSLLAEVETADPCTRINDGRADRHGGFVFGTKSEHADRRRVGRFYQYTARHGLRGLALPAAEIPNSICFDDAGTRMHFCDSADARIRVCRYDAASAAVTDLRDFVALDLARAEPDGSIIDAEGCLWNAQWGAGRVVRYRPDGSIERIVQVPVSQTTCCALAGDMLYVTTARGGLDPRETEAQPQAGGVFACRLERPLERRETPVRLP